MARRVSNRLTAREVAALKASGRYADGGGLYLVIDAAGRRYWSFVFQYAGKRKEMSLGPADLIELKEARDARDEAKRLVLAGRNPIEVRRVEAAQRKAIPTFGDYANEVVDGLGLAADKHREQWRRTLTTYVPSLQALPVDQVTTTHVLDALKPHWLEIPETAGRIRGRIERVLDAARAEGLIAGAWENPARWRGHLALLLPKPLRAVRHHPALPWAQLPDFMVALRARGGVSARALEFTILTAARTQETRFATPAEIAGPVWTVPGARMKMKRPHRVPLVLDVLELVEGMAPPAGVKRRSPWLFPGGKEPLALSNMAMDRVLRLEGLEVTVHGFRSTFKDWASDETDFPREVVEAALAHLVGDETERAYRRGDALEKRRRLMEAWADFALQKVRPARYPAPAET